jgi:hypothetical protein
MLMDLAMLQWEEEKKSVICDGLGYKLYSTNLAKMVLLIVIQMFTW